MNPQPLILLAGSEHSQVRELEKILPAGGYAVLTAKDEQETLDHARSRRVHGIVVDASLAPPGYALCHALRSDPAVSLATPIILTHPTPPTRAEQIEAWRAGAWDLRGEPLDPEEFLIRLSVFVPAKLELDRLSGECLVDRVSGLYNPEGLERRAAELAALATRQGLSLACAVFRPAGPLPGRGAADQLAMAFKVVGRASDAIGRTGQTEFAVFAPGTNTWAAARLVRRLSDSVVRKFSYGVVQPRGRPVAVTAGYTATQAAHHISPSLLLAKARNALEAR
jgi:PleD family two-component response regulator